MAKRARRQLDPNRLGAAAARPGIDPRTWTCLGVVQEVSYSAEDGFVLAVLMLEGALAGERVACELAETISPADVLMSAPFTTGDVAVCVVPEGDANNMPAVVGFLRTPGRAAPSEINGQRITADMLARTHVLASRFGAEVALGEPARIVAPQIKLGPTPAPTQPFVRGGELATALTGFLTKVGVLSTTAGKACGLVPILAPMVPFLEGLTVECTNLATQLVPGKVLSTSITGE